MFGAKGGGREMLERTVKWLRATLWPLGDCTRNLSLLCGERSLGPHVPPFNHLFAQI